MTDLRAILQGRSHLPALAAVFCLSLLVAGLADNTEACYFQVNILELIQFRLALPRCNPRRWL